MSIQTNRHMLRLIFSLLLGLNYIEAKAEETADKGQENRSIEPTSANPSVHLRVGRALDLEGAPVYAVRSSFSDTAAIATFSRRRPRSLFVFERPSRSTVMPLATGTLTSGFGTRVHPLFGGRRMHSGIDLAAPAGSPIYATSDGLVTWAGWKGGYGLFVSLQHGGGVETRYGHMSSIAVSPGQSVQEGEIIGLVGSTGNSTGPHLHYETRINGSPVAPIAGVSFGRIRNH